jgi:Kef-type K+ transport system membrane component KefB
MDPDNDINIFNQQIKPRDRVIGIIGLTVLAVPVLLMVTSLIAGFPARGSYLVDILLWCGAGVTNILLAFWIGLRRYKFTIGLLFLGAIMITNAFTHIIYLTILSTIGVIVFATYVYHRFIKPVLKEEEKENS